MNACLAYLQVKDPRKLKFPLKSVVLHDRIGIKPKIGQNSPLYEVGGSGAMSNSLSGGDL